MQGRKYSLECLRVQTAGETRIGTRERFSSTKEYTPIISGHKMRPDGEIQAADAEALYSGLPADLEVADVETPLAGVALIGYIIALLPVRRNIR